MTGPGGSSPPEPVFEQRFERPRRVLLVPAVAVLGIALWVGAAQIGRLADEPERQRNLAVASPSHPAEPTASPFAHPSTTPRPTAAPVLQLFGPPLAGRVLIRDAGLAYVDLATGQRSDWIGATGYVDRVLALPDGRFVCVCVRQRTVGEERAVEVTADLLDPEGERIAGIPLGTWLAADQAGYYDDVGPFSLDAAHDAAGDRLAVTVSVRRPPEWQREVLLVDLSDPHVVESKALPPAPSAAVGGATAQPGAPSQPSLRWAWAASPRFSSDGRHLLLSALEVDPEQGPEVHRTWVTDLEARGLAGLMELERAEGISGDPCLDAFPDFGAPGIVTTVCAGDHLAGPFVRRVRVDGTVLRRISLRDALKDTAPPYQLLDGRGAMWLWDPWTRRAVRIDLVAGRVDGLRSLGGSGVQSRLVDPTILLSPDATRLVAATADAAGNGLTGTGVLVLDAATLELVSELDVGPDMLSLGMSEDGAQLYVGHAPPVDAAGNPHGDAQMSVFDLRSGALRAVLGRLGPSGFTIVDPSMPSG